ncbi:class I SAM-dependent methyltransferase [Methylobacterium nigriterrae]|uniref:class I SAM-dependent methyltransferase n=1 Tax=Methylobacterium nigriterrae TaxID=3127512 RepID=UPI003013494E
MDEWSRAHLFQIPGETIQFCGADAIKGARILDVGCGDMLADMGYLRHGPRKLTGLDVNPLPYKNGFHTLAQRVRKTGYKRLPDNYAELLDFRLYDGRHFPFADASFDFVFSWSAFEHIHDIHAVLKEMHRVVTPAGRVFIQVYPWFGSRQGSHLDEWIKEPFFQHTRSQTWVKEQIEAYLAANPQADRHFLGDYMMKEYRSLNRISCADLYEAVREVGFVITRCGLVSHDVDLSEAPRGVPFAELMIGGPRC